MSIFPKGHSRGRGSWAQSDVEMIGANKDECRDEEGAGLDLNYCVLIINLADIWPRISMATIYACGINQGEAATIGPQKGC
ncbi:MAG: hypothetical protein JRN37_02145 [Nitrososphaerota archaeon]|jgi:hypothetical protein|nr:hypothetical protein [Nitrososphaerota archaeon]MDG7037954.1 hypothetical protein [Nitrososphaerota archaeon]